MMSAKSVAQLAQLLTNHTSADVEAKCGSGFFLERHATRPDARPKWAKFSTVAVNRDSAAMSSVQGDHRIICIPREGTPPFHQWVGIGRQEKNPIAIDDASVSKLHAIVRYVNGSFQLADAGSKNGTAVNGDPVARYDQGEARSLKPGDKITLGAVNLLFLGPQEMLNLLDVWRDEHSQE